MSERNVSNACMDLAMSMLIFAKYCDDSHSCTHCEHDVMWGPLASDTPIDALDEKMLIELGWHRDESRDCWVSYRFGSA